MSDLQTEHAMKLNFWQWIGVLMLIVGVVLALRKYVFN